MEYLRGSAGNYYYERDNTTYSADDGNLVVPTLTHYNWGWGGAEDAGNYYYERDNTTYSADDGNLVVPTLTHYNWGWGGAEDGFYQEPKYKMVIAYDKGRKEILMDTKTIKSKNTSIELYKLIQ